MHFKKLEDFVCETKYYYNTLCKTLAKKMNFKKLKDFLCATKYYYNTLRTFFKAKN